MLETEIKDILTTNKTIAVVGMSPKIDRPSHRVANYLIRAGYTIFPVNPGCNSILGLPCFDRLESIPFPVDIVDIFRKTQDVPGIVDSAIAIKAQVIWMQLDIIHPEAAQKAQQAGLKVIMDRCIKIDHSHLHQQTTGQA